MDLRPHVLMNTLINLEHQPNVNLKIKISHLLVILPQFSGSVSNEFNLCWKLILYNNKCHSFPVQMRTETSWKKNTIFYNTGNYTTRLKFVHNKPRMTIDWGFSFETVIPIIFWKKDNTKTSL